MPDDKEVERLVQCPACDRGEELITPSASSIVGSMPVHAPSGNICNKAIAKLAEKNPSVMKWLQAKGE